MADPRRQPGGGRLGRATSTGGRLDQPREPGRIRLPRISGETFGHFAEAFARFMGTARFIAYMTIFVIVWITINIVSVFGLRFDPYPFILLNLFFSTQASYAAPLILLAQNRQADRDRLTMEEDRRRAAMQKADTEYLSREIAGLRLALGDVATRDFIRSELNRIMEELDEAAVRRSRASRSDRSEQVGTAPDAAALTDLTLDEPRDDELDTDGLPDTGRPDRRTPRTSRGQATG